MIRPSNEITDGAAPLVISGWGAGACATPAFGVGRAAFHIIVFELSYQQCRYGAGSEHCRPRAGERAGRLGRILDKIASMSVFCVRTDELCCARVTRRWHSEASPAFFLPIANDLQ